MDRPSPLVPILVALLGLACFSVMDGLMKVATLALGAYGAMFWRNCFGSVAMLPVWLWRGNKDGSRGLPHWPAMRVHLLRAGVAAVMAVLFFHGLARTPLAEAMALSFIAPLIALYLAAATLGERIEPRAVWGSLLGLAGVAVIAVGKFGAGYRADAIEGLLAILASAVLYAWNLVLQRRQALLAGPEEIAFFQNLLIALLLGTGAWWLAPLPTAQDWLWLIGAAVLATFSLMMLGWSYARAEAQVLVPLEYSAFIGAAAVGWLLFGEPLTWRTLAGVVLIVGGCLLATWRRGAQAAA